MKLKWNLVRNSFLTKEMGRKFKYHQKVGLQSDSESLCKNKVGGMRSA